MSDILKIQQDKHEKTHQQEVILGQNLWGYASQDSPIAATQNSRPSSGSSTDYCSSSYMEPFYKSDVFTVRACVCAHASPYGYACGGVERWGACVHHGKCVDIREQFLEEGSLFPSCGSRDQTHTWWQEPLPMEPSQQPLLWDLNVLILLYLKTLCYSRILAILLLIIINY